MIRIPEIIIKEELEILIRRYYDDYVGLEQVGTVVDASNVDAGISVVVTQQGAVGVPEITEITCPVATNLSGTHWLLNTPTRNSFVWYNVSGGTSASIKPAITDKFELRVDVDVADTADVVATKTRAAIAVQVNYFTASVLTDAVTITNKETNAIRRSLLFQIFGDTRFDNMGYTSQMASMIKARYESEARKFVINLGYNKNREAFPQVSILLPSEENDPKFTGVDQGQANFYDGSFGDLKTHNFQTTYTLFITSDNYNEVILLYHFLKTIILVGINQFDARGMQNLWLSGRDITMDFDIDPAMLYHRTVALTFFYCNEVAGMESQASADTLNFDQTHVL